MYRDYSNQIRELVLLLVTESGKLPETPPLLVSYIRTLLVHETKIAIEAIDEEDEKQIKALTPVLFSPDINYDDLPLKIDDIESAQIALKWLRIVFRFTNNYAMRTIHYLSFSYLFNVIIASSRVLIPDEFKKTKELFNNRCGKVLVYSILQNSNSNLFSFAFLDKKTVPKYVEFLHKGMVVQSLYTIRISEILNDVSHMIPKDMSKHMIFHHVDYFIQKPSIHTAYIICEYLQQSFQEEYSSQFMFYQVSQDKKQQFFAEFAKNTQVFRSDLTDNHKLEMCDYFPYGMDANDAIKLLGTYPSGLGMNNLFNMIYQFPCVSLKLPDIFMESLNTKTLQQACSLCQQSLKHGQGFIQIFIHIGKYLDVLQLMMDLLPRIVDDKLFEPIWFSFISFIRLPWALGNKPLRNDIQSFIDQQTETYRDFLQIFITQPVIARTTEKKSTQRNVYYATPQQESNSSDYDVNILLLSQENSSTLQQTPQQTIDKPNIYFQHEFLQTKDKPFDKCIRLYNYLDSNSINSCSILIESLPYLWPSAIEWGIKSKSSTILKLGRLNIPDVPAIKTLFEEMIYCLKPNSATIKIMDYDFLIQTVPPLDEAERSLQRIVNRVFVYPAFYDEDALNYFIVAGRAWRKEYGSRKFLSILFNALTAQKTVLSKMIQITRGAKLLATVMGFINDKDIEKNVDMLMELESFVVDENCTVDLCILSEFAITLAMSVSSTDKSGHEISSEFFKRMCVLPEGASQRRKDFVYNIIKSSVTWSNMHDILDTECVKILLAYHDVNAAIEFYVYHSYYKEMHIRKKGGFLADEDHPVSLHGDNEKFKIKINPIGQEIMHALYDSK